jgi:electron transfer flavoprotein beta subunit
VHSELALSLNLKTCRTKAIEQEATLKIVIFIKQVVDVTRKIRVKDDGTIQEDGLEYVLSAHDACAIEEAIQIKEKNKNVEVTLVCRGPARARKAIREGLAIGADKAIHLQDDAVNSYDATANARIFARVLKTIPYDVVFLGKQAQDSDMQATAEILSEMLALPMASNCIKVDIQADTVVVHRQADRYMELIELGTPCIISVNNDLNNPRYLSINGIIASKKKPIVTKKPTDFGLREDQIGKAGSLIERLRYETPQARAAGKKFEGDVVEITNNVIELLTTEAKILG